MLLPGPPPDEPTSWTGVGFWVSVLANVGIGVWLFFTKQVWPHLSRGLSKRQSFISKAASDSQEFRHSIVQDAQRREELANEFIRKQVEEKLDHLIVVMSQVRDLLVKQ